MTSKKDEELDKRAQNMRLRQVAEKLRFAAAIKQAEYTLADMKATKAEQALAKAVTE